VPSTSWLVLWNLRLAKLVSSISKRARFLSMRARLVMLRLITGMNPGRGCRHRTDWNSKNGCVLAVVTTSVAINFDCCHRHSRWFLVLALTTGRRP
jgi:hypothetical protein